MIPVEEAEKIILSQAKDFGTETISFQNCLGRILAEDIMTDRDLPPFNRATMDGIAISYAAFEKGIRSFFITGIQAAGDTPPRINNQNECIEIMTGAALPSATDTMVRYEDIRMEHNTATLLTEEINRGQNIHLKGKDRKQNDVVAKAPQYIAPALISILATVGKTKVRVKKLPRVVIISTGNELVDMDATPNPYQIRKSNSYTIQAALQQYGLQADIMHIPDDLQVACEQLKICLNQYDVLLLSGGISMGKFDYVPQALEKLEVQKFFHKVQQRPGKPFWFGVHKNKVMIFAFPGNPVSTFLCLHRYFVPWLLTSLALKIEKRFAVLNKDVSFPVALHYFLQVQIKWSENGQLLANPIEGNGSGDFANLLDTDAFMELPPEQHQFKKGEAYRIWPFKQLV